jgi:hypothetical protein
MTRIGSVTMRFEDAKDYGPIVLKRVREDGSVKVAQFEFERAIYMSGKIVPGALYCLTHLKYRRGA